MAEEGVQDDDGSPCRIEPPQGVADEVSIDDGRRGIDAHWSVHRFELDLDRSGASMPEGVDAGTDEQAMEPAIETAALANRSPPPRR